MKFCLFILIFCILVYLTVSPSRPIHYSINSSNGKIYHGVYPGGFTGEEDDFSELDVISYEKSVEKKVAWVYFSNNWYKSRKFPQEKVDWINKRGSVPFIRLMLRCAANRGSTEDTFTLANINAGVFDDDLKDWFYNARKVRTPIFVEYGIEVNGEWFPWNGQWNGKEKGPEEFKSAYRRIIDISRHVGATNILWSFHIDDDDTPDVQWNKFENYYPGDEYIDFFTVSIYGMLTPADSQIRIFSEQLKKVYPRLLKLSPQKKIIIIEFGTTLNNPHVNQEVWAKSSLLELTSNNWENIIGFSWWNEAWHNKKIASTTMRVQDNPKLSNVFKNILKDPKISDSVSFNVE